MADPLPGSEEPGTFIIHLGAREVPRIVRYCTTLAWKHLTKCRSAHPEGVRAWLDPPAILVLTRYRAGDPRLWSGCSSSGGSPRCRAASWEMGPGGSSSGAHAGAMFLALNECASGAGHQGGRNHCQ